MYKKEWGGGGRVTGDVTQPVGDVMLKIWSFFFISSVINHGCGWSEAYPINIFFCRFKLTLFLKRSIQNEYIFNSSFSSAEADKNKENKISTKIHHLNFITDLPDNNEC